MPILMEAVAALVPILMEAVALDCSAVSTALWTSTGSCVACCASMPGVSYSLVPACV